jgi:ADP-ribose pyrophosphatase YjhB (NUDIX family)
VGIFPRLIYKSNKLLWKLFRPTTVGARIILAKDDSVLLVKHTYHDSWYLPGGRVNKGETFEQALRREVKEELGAELLKLSLHADKVSPATKRRLDEYCAGKTGNFDLW